LQPDNTSRATQLIAGRHDLLRNTASHIKVRDTSRQLSTQCVKTMFSGWCINNYEFYQTCFNWIYWSLSIL